MKQIIAEMLKLLAGAEPFALATVVTRDGSAPRSTGAKMLVRQDGGIAGTVGGGILEAQVMHLAGQMIRERAATVQGYQFAGEDANDLSAICGGQVEVLVEAVDPADPQTVQVIQGLADASVHCRKSWWVTVFDAKAAETSHTLVQLDGTAIGELPAGLSIQQVMDTQQARWLELSSQKVFIEPNRPAGTAFIFGAGHVSRSLAGFTSEVGFRTVVLDDRAEFANRERFPGADELIVVDSFEDVMQKVPIEPDSFIVIVTRGHENDLTVVAQALKTNAGYIGMIGSRHKCALTFEELRRQGFSEEDIQRVYAPIGIPIDDETPEEIGVSIVAQMIQVRARMMKE